MKLCPRCGRVLKRKRWVKPTPVDRRKAGYFEAFQREICDDCCRRPEAHNAILQVRGVSADLAEPLVAKASEAGFKKDKIDAWYRKKGDFFFTSKVMARKVASKLRDMGAELKETSKLVTYDNQGSKPLHRLTIAAWFRVVAGDLVQTTQGPEVVRRVSGSWAWTWGGKKVRIKDVKRLEAEDFSGLVISEQPPMVTVSETGESVEVQGGLLNAKPGQQVKLKKYQHQWWVV